MNNLKDMTFPKPEASKEELYKFLFKMFEALKLDLSGIDEDNLSENLKKKLNLTSEDTQ